MTDKYLLPNWPAPKNVRAYSTTRLGGHSSKPFDNFNMGARAADDPAVVEANRNQLIAELALPNPPLWLQQVHGIQVVRADQAPIYPTADASFTEKPGVVCVVLTADCLPVLICNRQGTQVAALHAGWRGLVAGIIETTLKTMSINPQDTLAWLGPAIGPKMFEVGDEVRQQFLAHDVKAQSAFVPKENQKWLANLYLLATQRLANYGVTQIYGGNYCTYTDAQLFFSHRRDQGKTGRMASLIWLE
jgi:polyphenol oxidase